MYRHRWLNTPTLSMWPVSVMALAMGHIHISTVFQPQPLNGYKLMRLTIPFYLPSKELHIMAENKFRWYIWSPSSKDDKPDPDKHYIRFLEKPHGLMLCICDKDGKRKPNGGLLILEFQTAAIVLLNGLSDKYG